MNKFLAGLLAFSLTGSVLLADEYADLVQKGDESDKKLQTKEALQAYLAAGKLQPPDVHLLCQTGKQYAESMNDTTDVDEKLVLGNQALDYAKRAVAADPKNAEAQLSLAIGYGRIAMLADNKTKISYSRQVKEHADIAVKLDPENDIGWHVLGVWTHNMAELNPLLKGVAGMIYGKLPDASNEDAVKYFQKAMALNPNRLGTHVELGKTYASMGRKDEARQEFQKALAMPIRQRDDAESKRVANLQLAKL